MLAFDINIRQWSLNMFGHVATPDMSRKSFKIKEHLKMTTEPPSSTKHLQETDKTQTHTKLVPHGHLYRLRDNLDNTSSSYLFGWH